MTDHDRELLKWVAEELGGWQKTPKHDVWAADNWDLMLGFPHPDKLQSWHGIGLVVEAMAKRDYWLELLAGSDPEWYASFFKRGTEGEGQSKYPWFAVYEATRKVVEGKEEQPDAHTGHP